MMPLDPKDDKAAEWLSNYLVKLRFEQDYYVYPGSSKKMFDKKGKQTGISIKRPYIELYSTGVTKLYEMVVEGVEYPDTVYTDEEEKAFDENMKTKFPEVFASQPKKEKK